MTPKGHVLDRPAIKAVEAPSGTLGIRIPVWGFIRQCGFSSGILVKPL